MYRRFQQLHPSDMSRERITGLCLYLHVLIKWGYTIPAAAFDAFVFDFPQYKSEMARLRGEHGPGWSRMPAYHHWFKEEVVEKCGGEMSEQGDLLHKELLLEIARENPYSAHYTESCMKWIAEREVEPAELVDIARVAYALHQRECE
jgi:hypothetical protein